MWRFEDGDGGEWDVTVGRESWGSHYAIFMERGEGRAVRQAPLDASSLSAATDRLDGLSDDEWAALFGSALPKSLG